MTSTYDDKEEDHRSEEQIKADNDNHANQLNPNNDAYWSSRGISRR
ncbi:MAG: hypothetical protein MRZ10_06615 [Methanomassiliicoccales archaeon]|nr:hypothetical protein [Methanomassiliicoccales archaeon]